MTTHRKQLLDPLLGSGTVRHVTEVSKQTFDMTPTPLLLLLRISVWTTRLHQNRKRRQHTLRIPQRYDHGRRFGSKNVIRKTRGDSQISERTARRDPADKQRRKQQ